VDNNERSASTEDKGQEFGLPPREGDDDDEKDRDQNHHEYGAHGGLVIGHGDAAH